LSWSSRGSSRGRGRGEEVIVIVLIAIGGGGVHSKEDRRIYENMIQTEEDKANKKGKEG